MITNLNYIDDIILREYIYNKLNKYKEDYNYIAVDDDTWGTNVSRIYGFPIYPHKEGTIWRSLIDSEQLFYSSDFLTTSPSLYDVFNNTEDIYDIGAILNNKEKDQRENSKGSEDLLTKILNSFDLTINGVFKKNGTKRFFRINKNADIEEYIEGEWKVTNLYEFIDIIDDIYDDDCPTFKYNVEKEFNEFLKKENEKIEMSDKTKKVIKSILETNYTFMKIYPHENRIVLHMNTDCVPLIINTDKETITWFIYFIENNTYGNKILYINRLKTFWEEEQTRN